MTLKTLDTSLTLLRFFTAQSPVWGVRELAKASGVHHSVVQRVLATCAEHNFVVQRDRSRTYALGMAFLELAGSLRESLQVSDLILPAMQRVCDATGETAYLAMLDRHEAVYLEIVEPEQSIKYTVRPGTRVPLHAGASAKVMLAFLPEAERDAVLDADLARKTVHTVVDRAALRAELEQIRAQGWARSVGEFAEGVFGLGLPLFDERERVIGSLGVSGPAFRFDDTKATAMLAAIRAERDGIESHIQRFY
jgi:DNA-binding IclR family transcriptional regulator